MTNIEKIKQDCIKDYQITSEKSKNSNIIKIAKEIILKYKIRNKQDLYALYGKIKMENGVDLAIRKILRKK